MELDNKHKGSSLVRLMMIIFLIYGCKKNTEEEKIIISGLYKPDSVMKLIGTPVMYTRNGPITNNIIINEFLNRKVGNYAAKFQDTILSPYNPPFNLEFLAAGIVRFDVGNPFSGIHIINAKISQQSNSEMIITHSDSLFRSYNSSPCSILGNLVTGFGQISTCSNSGASNYCSYLPFFKIKFENGQLQQYLITYLVSNIEAPLIYECYHLAFQTYDNFNPNIYSQFSQGDTIVVQSKKVRLIKQ